MCFFTQQNTPAKKIKQKFSAEIDNEKNLIQSNEINGFTYPNIPVILDDSPNLITTNYTWGLIPSWATNEDFRKNTLNARIETINEKPSFKDITQNRCLIIATGFYEWHWNDPMGKSKDKYQINAQDGEIFTFAGLYTNWKNPLTGELLNTYTMITTEGNELMSFVHNHKKRMPVILNQKDETAWLNNSNKVSEFAYPYETNLSVINLNKNNTHELF